MTRPAWPFPARVRRERKASEKTGQATAVSDKIKLPKARPDGTDTGVVSFLLVNLRGKWLVKDIDFDTEDRAKSKYREFGKKNPNATEIPAKPPK
jgi:hypothetical protein